VKWRECNPLAGPDCPAGCSAALNALLMEPGVGGCIASSGQRQGLCPGLDLVAAAAEAGGSMPMNGEYFSSHAYIQVVRCSALRSLAGATKLIHAAWSQLWAQARGCNVVSPMYRLGILHFLLGGLVLCCSPMVIFGCWFCKIHRRLEYCWDTECWDVRQYFVGHGRSSGKYQLVAADGGDVDVAAK
jgi:hypothetical protein